MQLNKYSTTVKGLPHLRNRGTAQTSVQFGGATATSRMVRRATATQPFEAVMAVTSRGVFPQIKLASKPTTANEWVQRHQTKLKKYQGQWIAVTAAGVVSQSSDFDEVYAKARHNGITNPLVFKVPKERTRKAVSAKR